jgi:hypothetical protein
VEQPHGAGGVLNQARRPDGYVFGYGSLLDPGSMATTLSGEHAVLSGPTAATLRGYRRAWNVAVPSGPGERRPLVDGAGTPYRGHVVSLGLEPADAACRGAVYGVTAAGLVRLDARELRYDRIEVTADVDGPGDAPVWTYRPQPEVVRRYARLRAAGQIVVTREYLRLVEDGMTGLGADALAAYRAEPLPDCPVVDLRLAADWPEDVR